MLQGSYDQARAYVTASTGKGSNQKSPGIGPNGNPSFPLPSLWDRGLLPATATAMPSYLCGAESVPTGIFAEEHPQWQEVCFATDASGGPHSKDPRLRVIGWAVVQELGVVSGVLEPGLTVPQGEQAESATYRPAMFPSWHSGPEERGRLSLTWVRSHGTDEALCKEFGHHNLYRKHANERPMGIADRSRAIEDFPQGHEEQVSRLDGICKEVCEIPGQPAWTLLSSEDRPSLDSVTPFCKKGRQPARTATADSKAKRPPP